jgi:hypothetical protein
MEESFRVVTDDDETLEKTIIKEPAFVEIKLDVCMEGIARQTEMQQIISLS